jgi:hypothetical protein
MPSWPLGAMTATEIGRPSFRAMSYRTRIGAYSGSGNASRNGIPTTGRHRAASISGVAWTKTCAGPVTVASDTVVPH